MNILFFGGTGYLGSKIVKNMISKGDNITCIIRKNSDNYRLKDVLDKISFYYLEELLSGEIQESFDCFINTAAMYLKSDVEEFDILNVNYIIPSKIFYLCIKKGIKKYITVDTALPSDFNIYSFSKKQFSDLGKWYCGRSEYKDIKFYNLKLEFFYGNDEPEDRFIHYVIGKLKKNEIINLTKGNQKRDFIHIDDVVNNILKIKDLNIDGYIDIPLGTGSDATIRDMVLYLKYIMNSSSILNFGGIKQRLEEPDSIADIDKMKKLGLEIKYEWREGFKTLLL